MKGKGRRVPQPPDARLRDHDPRMKKMDYEGAVIHFVQIGLGTNSTFVQNAVGSRVEWNHGLQWLEGCMRARKQGYMTGIAIEPVFELAQAQWKAARELPWVEVVHVAMGEYCMREAKMSVFGENDMEEVLETCARFPDEDLVRELEYFRNMSCIGEILPGFAKKKEAAEIRYGAMIRVREQSAQQWDWARLVESCRFLTCEVLVIDTEGSDTKILRSLIRHCRRHPNSWPYVIQFETTGQNMTVTATGSLQRARQPEAVTPWASYTVVGEDTLTGESWRPWHADSQCGRTTAYWVLIGLPRPPAVPTTPPALPAILLRWGAGCRDVTCDLVPEPSASFPTIATLHTRRNNAIAFEH